MPDARSETFPPEPSDALDARIDALLQAQPVKADTTQTQATLARIQAEAGNQEEAVEPAIEGLLEARPLRPKDDFTQKTLARIAEETKGDVLQDAPARREDVQKVVGFPAWVVAVSTMAAGLLIGMVAFVWLFFGINPALQKAGTPDGMAAVDPDTATPAPEGGLVAGTANMATQTYAADDPLLSAEMGELMVLQDDLFTIAMLLDDTDLQGLDPSILQ
ncbi:MAG: hypothetical protein ACFBZ8_00745 [Opitutales bacterium]